MKGLIEKDIRLVLIRRSTIVIFFIIGVVFTWSFSNSASGAYITMLGTMLALSTISYDDADNSMSFIFTLPCTRKQYVLEKYLFVYGFSLVAGIVGLIIIIVSSLIRGMPVTENMILETLMSELPILVITGGIMIPLQLKFGAEKSRIVLISVIGVIMILGYVAVRFAGEGNTAGSILNTLNSTNPMVLFIGLVAILIVLSIVSGAASIRIMEKKEL